MEEKDNVMTVEQPIVVRSYDVDFMNIVNNTVYVKWLEDLRMAILDKYIPLKEMLKDSCSPILAETCIQYKHPINLDSLPVGRCRIWLTGKSRWVAEHVIFESTDHSRVYATAQQSGYYFNIERRRPVPFPDFIIKRYLHPKQ